MNSQPHTLGIRTLTLYITFIQKKNLGTGLLEFKLEVINKKTITTSNYVLSNEDWGGTEDKLKIKKKLKGKTAHERERLAEIEQVNEADNIS